jgi:hypothetical protein
VFPSGDNPANSYGVDVVFETPVDHPTRWQDTPQLYSIEGKCTSAVTDTREVISSLPGPPPPFERMILAARYTRIENLKMLNGRMRPFIPTHTITHPRRRIPAILVDGSALFTADEWKPCVAEQWLYDSRTGRLMYQGFVMSSRWTLEVGWDPNIAPMMATAEFGAYLSETWETDTAAWDHTVRTEQRDDVEPHRRRHRDHGRYRKMRDDRWLSE